MITAKTLNEEEFFYGHKACVRKKNSTDTRLVQAVAEALR